MAVREKVFIPNEIYFITFTILDWQAIFINEFPTLRQSLSLEDSDAKVGGGKEESLSGDSGGGK